MVQSYGGRYVGLRAERYEAARAAAAKWSREHEAMRELLEVLPAGLDILDVPCGTGRFFGLYRDRGHRINGVDLSAEMLAQARAKGAAAGVDARLVQGDIHTLAELSVHSDVVVCVRLLNWVATADLASILAQLGRASRRHVIAGIRHQIPPRDMGAQLPAMIVGRCALRAWRRLRPGTTVHRLRDVEGAFRAAGLIIEGWQLIERALAGTEYRIYLLRKA